MYPIVPGHELAGVVVEVGPDVKGFKKGDHVGIGPICDSCMDCPTCLSGEQQYCENGGSTPTYNSLKHGKYEKNGKKSHYLGNPDVQNFGGYAGSRTVHEDFLLKIPDSIPLEKAGPIMCAGITLFDPMVYWGFADGGPKKTIGICGLGGLGTMGVKLAHALGHRVVAISRTAAKE